MSAHVGQAEKAHSEAQAEKAPSATAAEAARQDSALSKWPLSQPLRPVELTVPILDFLDFWGSVLAHYVK